MSFGIGSASFAKKAMRMVTGSRRSLSSTTRSFIDVHTHMYTPKYMDILRARADIPKVRTIDGEDRLIILPGEELETTTKVGRPIGREYWSVDAKIEYMNNHGIQSSIISLANPWLDFLQGDAAANVATELNDELLSICANSKGRLHGFATLPVRNVPAAIREVQRLRNESSIKGVILGTPGAGNGLDDEGLRDLLHAINDAQFTIFLHPHYGVGNEHFHNAGHALFLALGFPFETTVSISRLIVSGTLDQVKGLKILVAHAGAALPSLIGRLDSCVAHDIAVANRLSDTPSNYLKSLYFDAISYSPIALQSLVELVGPDRVLFGTDNPFFPPVGVSAEKVCEAQWPSTVSVQRCIAALPDAKHQAMIVSENAKRLFRI